MEQFIIEGGQPLRGSMRPSGNKNAALPLLAACLLTDSPVILHNVPAIRDVQAMRKLMVDLGVTIEALDPGGHTLRIQANGLRKAELDPELCKAIRASILLAGPLLARLNHAEVPQPGGDVIGRRRVDTHFQAFDGLGASIEFHGHVVL